MNLVVGLGRVAFWLCWPLLWVYLRFGARTRVLVTVGDEVLVTKGWLGTGRWVLPGGGLKRGEDPRMGAVRELHEETGLRVEPGALKNLGMARATDSGLHFRYYQYAVRLPNKPPLMYQREIVEASWVSKNDITSANAERSTLDTLNAA